MIAKIMSEVSHSIVGMLSAKPVDMETRASNPDFTALLSSSDEQYRLAPDAGSPRAPDQENPDRFLEQLVGIENQTHLTSSTANATPTMPTDILKGSFSLDGELSGGLTSETPSAAGDTSFASAATEPEIASDTDNTRLEHTGTIATAGGIAGGVISSSSPGRPVESRPSLTDAKGAMPALEIMPDRLPGSAARQSAVGRLASAPASSQLDSQITVNQDAEAIVRPSVSSESIVSKAELMGRPNVDLEGKIGSSNARLALSRTENSAATVESHASMHGIGGDLFQASKNMARPNFIPTLPTNAQNSAVKPKIVDSIDLRLASKAEAKGSSIPSSQEIEFSDVFAGGEKRVIADTKTALAGSYTTASVETPVRDVPGANLPIQSATHKTVNFDWNAPNFAGRFAAEVSGLTTDGDTRKFQINPRNLGRLEVAFVSRGTSEFIRIEAESDAARDVIVQNTQAIQDMLKAQGRPDLTIRVDVKEGGFSSLNGGDLNQAQEESAGADEGGSNSPPNSSENRAREMRTDTGVKSQTTSDNSRYA